MSNAWTTVLRMQHASSKPLTRIALRWATPCLHNQTQPQCLIARNFQSYAPCGFPKTKRSPKTANARAAEVQKPSLKRRTPDKLATKTTAVRASAQDVLSIFGRETSARDAYAVLRELQHRRETGELIDIGTDVSAISTAVTEEQTAKALAWLRMKYPIDEALAASIYAELEEERLRKAMEAKAAQSFIYEEDKKEEDKPPSPPGSLAVETWSPEKRAKWKAETERLEALEKEAAQEQAELSLAVAQQQIELAERRDDKLARWDELEKKAELDPEKLMDETRSASSRLGRPLAFGAVSILVMLFCLNPSAVTGPQQGLATQVWNTPDLTKISPAMGTCGAITAVNLLVLLAWRNPRLWYSMNRSFLLSAGSPNTFSVLGSVFSHQRWIMHLATNTALLFAIGMPLYDEIGRGNFLIIYFASGIFASCSSLIVHVLQRNFLMTSLGASGAVMGLYAAFFTVRERRDLYIPIWDKHITYNSQWAVTALLVLEALVMWRTKAAKYDHVNHIAGLLAGMVIGRILRPRKSDDEVSQTMERAEYVAQVSDKA